MTDVAIYDLTLEGHTSTLVATVQLKDQLSSTYELEIVCALPKLRETPARQACESLRLSDATLAISRHSLRELGPLVKVHGVVLEAKRLDTGAAIERGKDFAGYEQRDHDWFWLKIGPALACLDYHVLGVASDRPDEFGTTFHEQSYIEILKAVLEPALSKYGRTVRYELTKDETKPAECVTRAPGETLLEFLQRVASYAGLFWFFDHKEGTTETLVLADSNAAFIKGETWTEGKPLTIDIGELGPTLFGWDAKSHVGPAGWFQATDDNKLDAVALGANIKLPALPSSMNALVTALQGALGSSLGALGGLAGGGSGGGDSGGGAEPSVPSEGLTGRWNIGPDSATETQEQLAKLAETRALSEQRSVKYKTNLVSSMVGHTFRIESNGEVVEHVVHTTSFRGSNRGQPVDYSDFLCDVQAVPTADATGQELPVQPIEAPPIRTMPGVSIAEVVSLEYSPVDTNDLLGCRVRYLWEGTGEGARTTYLPVLQTMGGRFGGSHALPREGDRVVVAFPEGNPNRGIVLGCLYHRENPPPFLGPPDAAKQAPDSRFITGWRHASITPGSSAPSPDRHSMQSIDVTDGKELFYTNAPHDWRLDIGRNSDIEVKEGNATHTIKKGDLTETLDEGDYLQEIKKGDRTEKVKGKYSLFVEGGANYQIEGGEIGSTTTTDGPVKLTTTKSVDYTASQVIKLNAPKIELNGTVGGSGGSGDGAPASVAVGSTATIDAPRGAKMVSGPSSVTTDAESVSTSAPAVHLQDEAGGRLSLTKGTHVVEAPEGITFRCGNTVLELTPEGLVITAGTVKIRTAATGPGVRSIEFDNQQLVMKAGHIVMETQRFDVLGEDPLDDLTEAEPPPDPGSLPS